MSDEHHKEDNCPHCGTRREAHLNFKTGAGVVTTALDCKHRSKCEAEMLPGLEPDDAEIKSLHRAFNDLHEAETLAAMRRTLLPADADPETVNRIANIFGVAPEKLR